MESLEPVQPTGSVNFYEPAAPAVAVSNELDRQIVARKQLSVIQLLLLLPYLYKPSIQFSLLCTARTPSQFQ